MIQEIGLRWSLGIKMYDGMVIIGLCVGVKKFDGTFFYTVVVSKN